MINSKIFKISDICDDRIEEMYQLYSEYYGGTSRAIFIKDLQKKDEAIVLADETGKIQGFSTVKTIETEFEGKPIRAIFSGDTIVHHLYWGKNDLAQQWLRHASQIKRMNPSIPLYWFLIVKGHRTYRYLSVFSRKYYPARESVTPISIQNLMDHLAMQTFGEFYDQKPGILRFPDSRGHLQMKWADVPIKDLKLPEVQFFLERNPGYRKGDELVCLCELSEENLKPLTQRFFCKSRQGALHEFT
jgi:hypothetical protein